MDAMAFMGKSESRNRATLGRGQTLVPAAFPRAEHQPNAAPQQRNQRITCVTIVGMPELELNDELYMRQALALAARASRHGEVPVGAVVVANVNGQRSVVGRGFNLRETRCDPTAHAEILALRQAGRKLGLWRLTDCTLYVTLEPCAMCSGAAVNARLQRIVYGCADPKAGAVDTLYTICADERLNHRTLSLGGVCAAESAALLQTFFRARRASPKT
jgi:tRNA(adenine34) deaminase